MAHICSCRTSMSQPNTEFPFPASVYVISETHLILSRFRIEQPCSASLPQYDMCSHSYFLCPLSRAYSTLCRPFWRALPLASEGSEEAALHHSRFPSIHTISPVRQKREFWREQFLAPSRTVHAYIWPRNLPRVALVSSNYVISNQSSFCKRSCDTRRVQGSHLILPLLPIADD